MSKTAVVVTPAPRRIVSGSSVYWIVNDALATCERLELGRKNLENATEVVDRYLADGGEIFIELEGAPELYQVFDDLGGEEHGEAQANLEAMGAEDEACSRWTPVIDAAYYVGLAMGLKLAGGGK